MNKRGRLRFSLGILAVLSVSISLLLYMQHSMTRITSDSAQIGSKNFTVGVGYSGIIERQYIDEGAFIKKGDPLFELRSPTLLQAIQDDEITTEQLLYSIAENGNILISAVADGQVQEILFRSGAFVPANSAIALINSEGELFVRAIYKLNPPDYSKIASGSRVDVTLPDSSVNQATVQSVSLELIDRDVQTIVEARLENQDDIAGVFTIGTPVESTLYLSGDSWYSQLKERVSSYIDDL